MGDGTGGQQTQTGARRRGQEESCSLQTPSAERTVQGPPPPFVLAVVSDTPQNGQAQNGQVNFPCKWSVPSANSAVLPLTLKGSLVSAGHPPLPGFQEGEETRKAKGQIAGLLPIHNLASHQNWSLLSPCTLTTQNTIGTC